MSGVNKRGLVISREQLLFNSFIPSLKREELNTHGDLDDLVSSLAICHNHTNAVTVVDEYHSELVTKINQAVKLVHLAASHYTSHCVRVHCQLSCICM